MDSFYHIPALLEPTIEGLHIRPDGVYADCTFGGGGHSRAIISRLGEEGKLFSFDQDIDAYQNRIEDKRWQFINSNFRYISNFMQYYKVDKLDGILADLGVSSHHFDTAERGFSFRYDAPLDMRMNRSARLTAADIVNTYSEEELSKLLFLYGELRQSRQIAKLIVRHRASQPITRTEQLLTLIKPAIGRDKDKKDLAKVFQALRIEVNDEMGALQQLLKSSLTLLRAGGRIAILTYHSLEDRLVKNFFRSGNIEGQIEKDFYGNQLSPFRLVNSKVITPTEEETVLNPRARSAKLRIAELIEEQNSNSI